MNALRQKPELPCRFAALAEVRICKAADSAADGRLIPWKKKSLQSNGQNYLTLL